ncbi:MAG: hypothetical protein RI907_1702 [Pseudomonadota bacterium]|jgi:PAS domain S-box-containing protein
MERLTLEQVKAHIDGSMQKTLDRSMQVVAAFALGVAGLAWLTMPTFDAPQRARVAMSLVFALTALVGIWVSRRWKVRAAAAYFSTALPALALVTAWLTGTGVMSATMVLMAMAIVIAGFVLGPRAGWLAGAGASGIVGLLCWAQWHGWVPGVRAANSPAPAIQAMVLILAFLAISVTVAQYGRMLWRLLLQLEGNRQELEDRVSVQAAAHGRLQEGQQRLTALLDHAPISIFVLNKDTGELSFANRQALLAHGAHSLDQLIAECLFCEAPYRREVLLSLVHRARDVGTVSQQWCSRATDGRTLWWSVRLDLLNLSEQPQVVLFGQDITENLQQQQSLLEHRQDLERQVQQRTAEVVQQRHRLEAVIEALPMALTIKDRQGRFLLSNRRFEEAFGLNKDLLIGCTPHELFPPALAERLLAHEDALLQTPQMVRFENTLMGRDGNSRDQLVTKVPLLDARQQPEAVLTVAVDITEQKVMQRDLVAAKTEAERLGQVKTEFLANMSHEIRTPLHGMLGMAQVAQGSPDLPKEAAEAIERILKSGRHLMGVIDDILDFSRLDAGKFAVEQGPYAPDQLVQEVCDLVQAAALDKGLTLNVRCEASPPQAMGDLMRTRQILLNLMANAIKFTQQGSVTLCLHATTDQLLFDVIDTGIGMSEEAQRRVFSPFEQADTSTSRRFGGTGLGLSISRHLARLQGGDITVRSQVGQGATFTLALPLLQAQPKPSAAPAAPLPGKQVNLQGLRILAADDVDINREILQSLLRKRGAELVSTEDGQQALACVSRHGAGHFDIALMDVQMPVMDGVEATRRILEIDPTLPVLALTAHAMPEETQRCLAAGMVDHLAKPFDAQDMVQRIDQWARRRPATATAMAESGEATGVVEPQATESAPQATSVTLELDKALARCGDQEALLRKLLQRFADQQGDFVARTRVADGTDIEAQGRAVHQFKGTVANLGMPQLAAVAAQLEAGLRAEVPLSAEALSPLWQDLADSLAAHLDALRGHLDEALAA